MLSSTTPRYPRSASIFETYAKVVGDFESLLGILVQDDKYYPYIQADSRSAHAVLEGNILISFATLHEMGIERGMLRADQQGRLYNTDESYATSWLQNWIRIRTDPPQWIGETCTHKE